MTLADMGEPWKIAEGLWRRSQESQRPKEGVGWEKSLAASRMKLVFFDFHLSSTAEEAGRVQRRGLPPPLSTNQIRDIVGIPNKPPPGRGEVGLSVSLA